MTAIERYLKMRAEKPMSQLGDIIHAVHTGTEWEAELRLSDLQALVALLAEAAEALGQIRCPHCCGRIGNRLIAGCRTCRPTRELLERLRGSR